MNNFVINKFDRLSPEIQLLVSKRFNSKDHPNTIYFKGYSDAAHMLKLPYYFLLFCTIITFGFFAFQLLQETIQWNSNGEFRTEGIAILGMIFLFFGLFFLTIWILFVSDLSRGASQLRTHVKNFKLIF